MIIKFVSISKYARNEYINNFDCGDNNLNEYLKKYARQNDHRRLGRTFLLIKDDFTVIGFYTLTTGEIRPDYLDEEERKRLPKYPIPCLRICRLAVDKKYQGSGFGKTMIKEIIKKTLQISDIVGLFALIVEPKDSAVGFYEHYGFKNLKVVKKTMILPISCLKLIEKRDGSR